LSLKVGIKLFTSKYSRSYSLTDENVKIVRSDVGTEVRTLSPPFVFV